MFRDLGLLHATWRFMGSYTWGYKSLIWVISIVTLLITLLITTHEPPSRVRRGVLEASTCEARETP